MHARIHRTAPSVPTADTGTRETTEPVFVAIVSAVDGARFITIATHPSKCIVRVAAYVAEEAREHLWPHAADRVDARMAAGDLTGAIAEYFRHSGERWDTEWLTTLRLHPDALTGRWSGVVPLRTGLEFDALTPNGEDPSERLTKVHGAADSRESA
jgi:hypothetical protein